MNVCVRERERARGSCGTVRTYLYISNKNTFCVCTGVYFAAEVPEGGAVARADDTDARLEQVRVCVFVSTCLCVCIYMYAYMCMRVYVQVCVGLCVCVVCACVCACMRVCARACVKENA